MIKVVLADDHEIVMDGLKSILSEVEGIEIVFCAKDGQEAVDFILTNQVDVAVLDISMPILNGIEATKIICSKTETRVLILSMHDEYDFIDQLLDAGGKGYILKNKGKEELVDAIHLVYEGKSCLGQKVQERLLEERFKSKKESKKRMIQLTSRELEIIRLIAQDFNTPEIAAQLSIKESTVNTHRRNLIQKLDVKSSMGLVSYAFRNKLIE